jgi:hypothetical protein
MKKGQGGVERRQLGTIISPSDKIGNKEPRRLQVYLPHIGDDENPAAYISWKDNEQKKTNIEFEYGQ